jgi:uncharacterized membrane protein YccC
MPWRHAFKTGVAAAVALLVTRALGFERHGTWAVFTAVIVMQSNLGASFAASWQRLLGTTLGAGVGFAAAFLPWTGPVPMGLAVTGAVALCSALRLHESIRVAGVTAALVVLGDATDPDRPRWGVGLERFAEVVLGIVIALIVGVAVFPSRAAHNLREGLAASLRACGPFYAVLTEIWFSGAAEVPDVSAARTAIRETRRKNVDLLRDLRREPAGLAGLAEADRALPDLTERVETIQERLFVLEHIVIEARHDACYRAMQPALSALRGVTAGSFAEVAAALSAGRPAPDPAPLQSAVSAAQAEYARLRAAGAGQSCGTGELMRFFSLFHTLEEVARELIHITGATREGNGEGDGRESKDGPADPREQHQQPTPPATTRP